MTIPVHCKLVLQVAPVLLQLRRGPENCGKIDFHLYLSIYIVAVFGALAKWG